MLSTTGDQRLKLAALISGNGSNLQAIIDHIRKRHVPCDIQLAVSNVPSAYGLVRAQRAGIRTAVLDHRDFGDRPAFDRRLLDTILAHGAEWILLAGFMRILTDEFVDRFHGRMLNIHPSLLPDLKGLDTHRRALEAGCEYHGATVHFVTSELDSGPVVVRGILPILEGDNPQTLQQRVHRLEHRIYPLAVEWVATGRLKLEGNTVYLDHRALPPEGVEYRDDETLQDSRTGKPTRADPAGD